MDISFTGVEHTYMAKTPFEKKALENVTMHIPDGRFTAIIGHTGSGKSTLIQHLNGLLKPSKGTIQIGPYRLEAGKKYPPMRELREKVGLVFQYPEHQLFEETVEKDIMFGPRNFGVEEVEIKKRLKELLPRVGITEDMLQTSPFQLSGGQMRRVAIASVLISHPKILVLDEPTAGLDPLGQKEMLELFYNYHQSFGTTTVLVTHQMEVAAQYADHLIVMDQGMIKRSGTKEEVFSDSDLLEGFGLAEPEELAFLRAFNSRFQLQEQELHFDIDSLTKYISNHVRKREKS